jgi:hypothetical protein
MWKAHTNVAGNWESACAMLPSFASSPVVAVVNSFIAASLADSTRKTVDRSDQYRVRSIGTPGIGHRAKVRYEDRSNYDTSSTMHSYQRQCIDQILDPMIRLKKDDDPRLLVWRSDAGGRLLLDALRGQSMWTRLSLASSLQWLVKATGSTDLRVRVNSAFRNELIYGVGRLRTISGWPLLHTIQYEGSNCSIAKDNTQQGLNRALQNRTSRLLLYELQLSLVRLPNVTPERKETTGVSK